MPLKAKAVALASMWTGLGISLYTLASVGFGVQLAVLGMGLAGTVAILFFVRTNGRTTEAHPVVAGVRVGRWPRPGTIDSTLT